MLRETMDLLGPERGGVFLDATVGMGGHAVEALGKMAGKGLLIGIDRDDNALKAARDKLGSEHVVLKKARFSELGGVLDGLGIANVNGALFDLGVSMPQLKVLERGFSFQSEGPLDMRMDPAAELTAADVVNTYSEKELERILREYGEERFSKRIARMIVQRRPIQSAQELAGLVSGVYRKRGKTHPATRAFQALRIEVNSELAELEAGLAAASGRLAAGGRLVVISYHSLEDRIVKHFFRGAQARGEARILTKKPLTPGDAEVRENPAARSAKLRALERAA